MEMEKHFKAADEGNVNSLKKVLQEDPIILDKVSVDFSDTPIHVAAILGHSNLVKEILRRRPKFARELNSSLSLPLHLASAKGYIEVVRVLLCTDPLMCLARDGNGLTPLHLAAIKGHTEVVKELFEAKSEAAQMIVGQQQTILHLCVKNYQFEALKFLVNAIRDEDFTNRKDSDGNTILHLAVADKQVETIKFLLKKCAKEVNAKNLRGMTPMDVLSVLIRGRRDMRDEEIEECLKHAGALGSEVQLSPGLKMFEQNDDWSEKKRSALMVVASLIATMAFQVGVNPPGGVWQDTNTIDSKGNPVSVLYPHKAGESIYAHNYPTEYRKFLIINTTGLIASLTIILLLISGLPIRRRIFVWILMVITWIAISAVALTYLVSIIILTPEIEKHSIVIGVGGFAILLWLGIMILLFIGHAIRLIIKMTQLIRGMIRKSVEYLSPEERIGSSGNHALPISSDAKNRAD